MIDIPPRVISLRKQHQNFPINTPKPGIERDLKPGFLLRYLLDLDLLMWGRWDYWFRSMVEGTLLDEPIPQIEFLGSPNPRVRKMLETSLDTIPNHGSGGWQSMGAWEHFRYLLKWMLFGFGDRSQPELPTEPFEGASMRLYQVLNIDAMMLWPFDYFGDLLAENAYGKRQGFYPTPMHLVELMSQMVFGEGDLRTQSFTDPCVGTGRFPLIASNYSLIVTGQDVDRMMVDATLVNGYLYAPWMVRPFPFLKTAVDEAEVSSIDPQAPEPASADAPLVETALALQGAVEAIRPAPSTTVSAVRRSPVSHIADRTGVLDLFTEPGDSD